MAGEAPKGKPFRIGGLVKEGSIKREADGVTMRFIMPLYRKADIS